MTTVACVVIVGRADPVECQHRQALVRDCTLPSILGEGFDEVVVVGDFTEGDGYRYLPVPPLTGTTLDALVKRDVGALATTSDLIVYCCDDHRLIPHGEPIAQRIREFSGSVIPWDVAIPVRFADHPEQGRIRINNGESRGYCGGHAGVFRRRVLQARPWSAMPHHRLWDLYSSQQHQQDGFRYVANAPLQILDLEPERCPWQ